MTDCRSEGTAPCSPLPSRIPPYCLYTMMRSVSRPDIVVAYHADRPVRLEHGEHHVLDVRHAVLAQGLPQLVVRDPGPQSVLLQDLSVVDEHDALAREQLGDAAAPDAPPVNHPMPADQ